MKLIHADLEVPILSDQVSVMEWIIESPALFLKYVYELYRQSEGQNGEFVLSEKDKILDINKCVEVIVDPFSIQVNDRKVLAKLYDELEKRAFSEENYLQTQELLSVLRKYFVDLEQDSEYSMEMEDEIGIASIFKMLGIKLVNEPMDFLNNINQYIKVQAELMKKKLIVLVNFQGYFNSQQLKEVIKNALYQEIAVIFIENVERNFSLKIPHFIIDKDGCEIF